MRQRAWLSARALSSQASCSGSFLSFSSRTVLMTKNSMSGAAFLSPPSPEAPASGSPSPAVGAGVVVAERGAERDPAAEQLGVRPVELLLEIFLVAAAPEGPVNV